MAPEINLRMGTREWTMLLVLSVLWGGSFFFIDVAVESVAPFTLVLLRVLLGAATLLLVLKVTGQKLPFERRTIGPFLTLALLNNAVPFSLFAWGQQHIASGLASILNATTPLWAVLVAHVFTGDEKATPLKILGVAVGFSGVALMIGGDALSALGVEIAAQLAMLAAAIAYAFAGVYGRRFKAMGVEPMVTAAGMLTASTVLLTPVMLVLDRPWTLPMPSAATIAAVAGLALVSTSLAYILYFRILASAGATNLLLVTFLIPVSAILMGATILGERLAARHFFGMALIGVGLAAIDGRLIETLRRGARPRLSSGSG